MTLPDDLILSPEDDIAIRQDLVLVALGKSPADVAIRVGRLLNVHTRLWQEDMEIVIKGRRIAWTGPGGTYRGEVARRVHYPDLSAVPGFGEVHKHIESTHLTPEFEAALTLPMGNTWTCEAAHEFGNVSGSRNTEFWQRARKAGVPQKVFIQPGSAVPPSAWEVTGGHYGEPELSEIYAKDLSVCSLDEVMDWPAVWNPKNPSYSRLWGLMRASVAHRAVVEGHGAGLTEAHDASAFAATPISSDHENWAFEDAWAKLTRGVFIEIRPYNFPAVIPGLLEKGLADWSHVAFTTDDRSASETLETGATDHNLREAIRHGVPAEAAIQCVTINPARHMRLDQWVGSIAPGCYADIVLLDDVEAVHIKAVWSDGRLVAEDGAYVGPAPAVTWPAWARDTMHIGREITASDFAVRAPDGRDSVTAAVIRPFHWAQDFMEMTLPVSGGEVQRDNAQLITKFAILDRHLGKGDVAAMFWKGCGPRTPGVGLACSVAHDSHNIWAVGSDDAAMAQAVNHLAKTGGGWALVRDGEVIGEVGFEIAGLMTARPAAELDAEMARFLEAAEAIDWMYEPSATEVWKPGFPHALVFATLTCAPWRWVLVAPNPAAPNGFVNVETGESHPIVW